MIEPTSLSLSGDRIQAVYEFHGDVTEAEARANALRVEQTIEFPADLVPDDDIQREIVGRIESIDVVDSGLVQAVVSYAVETTGYELPQLMNVLWGNSALLPGIRLIDFTLPDSLLEMFPGPRFGIEGLREMFDAPVRPLLATALKPMGLSADRLAAIAHDLALGGMDMIKDDHSLANQPFAPFIERGCSVVRRRWLRQTPRPDSTPSTCRASMHLTTCWRRGSRLQSPQEPAAFWCFPASPALIRCATSPRK